MQCVFADGSNVLQTWLGKNCWSASSEATVLPIQQYTDKISTDPGLCQDHELHAQQPHRNPCDVRYS